MPDSTPRVGAGKEANIIATSRHRAVEADDEQNVSAAYRKLPTKPPDDPLFVDKGNRIFVWATDVTFTSSTKNERLVASDPIDVTNWEVVFAQFDVLENDASPGDFYCNLATGFFDAQWADWAPVWWTTPPAPFNLGPAGSSQVVWADDDADNPLRQYLRWGVTHAVTGGPHTIRYRVIVFYKSRSRQPPRDRGESPRQQIAMKAERRSVERGTGANAAVDRLLAGSG